MKRAAAIIGPTPSFVRWTIRHHCAFRQIDEDDLPHQTFRQLRGLREISVGQLERRMVEGFCIHPELNQDVDTARGFPVDEVLNFFGDPGEVHSTCGSCPANVARWFGRDEDRMSETGTVWAGCYGWLTAVHESLDLIDAFEQAGDSGRTDSFADFDHAHRVWFRLWQTRIWTVGQLTKLAHIIQNVRLATPGAARLPDLINLQLAVDACLKHALVLETELIPGGNSDGVHWRIESHCSRCRCETEVGSKRCAECGHRARPVDSIKRKVLGLRPYIVLKEVIGLLETERLLAKFHEMKRTQ